MATKAVHLELLSDQSVEEFVAAFYRFCSRHGTPSEMWSDNGANFRGTCKELEQARKTLLSQDTGDICERPTWLSLSAGSSLPVEPHTMEDFGRQGLNR